MTGPAGELSVGAKTYCEEKLDEILTGYAKTFENKFVEYGKATEEKARLAIEEFYGKDTMICGLITHPELPYYKGSLDSVIDLDGLFAVEINALSIQKNTVTTLRKAWTQRHLSKSPHNTIGKYNQTLLLANA